MKKWFSRRSRMLLFVHRDPVSSPYPSWHPYGTTFGWLVLDFRMILECFWNEFWMVRACSDIPDAQLSEVAFRPKLPTTLKTLKTFEIIRSKVLTEGWARTVELLSSSLSSLSSRSSCSSLSSLSSEAFQVSQFSQVAQVSQVSQVVQVAQVSQAFPVVKVAQVSQVSQAAQSLKSLKCLRNVFGIIFDWLEHVQLSPMRSWVKLRSVPNFQQLHKLQKLLNSPLQGFDRRLSCNGRAVEDIPPTKVGGGGASP